jgi:hypothetical protein
MYHFLQGREPGRNINIWLLIEIEVDLCNKDYNGEQRNPP